MPDPTPPEKPAAATPAEGEAADGIESASDAETEAAAELPLNRAARRGHAKEQQQKPPPGHVGPQNLRGRSGPAQRSHTKRRSV